MQCCHEIHLHYLESFLNFERVQIFTYDLARLSGLFDEINELGAPANRFDSDRAGSRTTVEEYGSLDSRAEDIEQGFSQLVARWPDAHRRRPLQTAALELTGNNSHTLHNSSLRRLVIA